MCGTHPTAGPLAAQVQPFLAVNPVHPLVRDVPANTSKQGVDAKITAAERYVRDYPDAQAKHRIVTTMRIIPKRCPMDMGKLADAPLAHAPGLPHVRCELSSLV